MSNRSLRQRWLAHSMDWRAWTENKLSPGFLTLPLKAIRKLQQFWRRHKGFIFSELEHSEMTFSRFLCRSQLEFSTVRSSRFVVGFLCLSSLANAAGGKFANELCGRWTL